MEYNILLNNKMNKLYLIVNKLKEKDLSITDNIRLRKEYIIVADESLELTELLKKNIEFGRDKCLKSVGVVAGGLKNLGGT